MLKADAIRLIAATAMERYDTLSVEDKIKLLRACAAVLPGDEGTHAGQSAFLMEKLQHHQLEFRNLMKTLKQKS